MKKNSYLLNTLLALFVMTALAVMVLVRTFQPAAILPVLNIPTMVIISLAALLADYFLAPEADRCYICIPVFSVLTFGLLPLAAGFATLATAWKLALVGSGVFTLVTWLFSSMTDRMSTGRTSKAAAVAGALGIWLAFQCFSGIIL